MMAESVIQVRGLRRFYGEREEVCGIDLDVKAGRLRLPGTHGAGKTTTVEILEGYRSRHAGQVSGLDQDPARGDREWR